MNQPALATLFYNELQKVFPNPKIAPVQQTKSIHRLLNLLLMEVTKQERIQFSTLFARMAYVGHKHQLPKNIQYYAHWFRRQVSQHINDSEKLQLPLLGAMVLAHMIRELLGELPPAQFQHLLDDPWPVKSRYKDVQAFFPKVRVVVLEEDVENKQLIARAGTDDEDLVRIQYHIPERNENFDPSIEVIRNTFGFPVTVNLIDVEVDHEGVYRPAAFVVEPDYLIDVTAVAEAFKEHGSSPMQHLLKRFLPLNINKYLLLGHIANFFLDELVNNPDITFKELFPKVFQLNPLAFCLLDNALVREIMNKAQLHYVNLKRIVLKDFPEQDITADEVFLEPTFLSETYGLQGRLDLFSKKGDNSTIIELKSGKPFRPNVYGLSVNHYTQTLLYDMMVRDVFDGKTEPANYILYSGIEERNLRFAPRIRTQQYEALQLRNQLVALERQLADLALENEEPLSDIGQRFFGQLRPERFPKAKGFIQRDLEIFAHAWDRMLNVEKAYFTAFSSFIAREHQMAKTGEQNLDTNNGVAALWLNNFDDKQENFEIISHLKIQENKAGEEEPQVIFQKTALTNDLANFRKGDIAVLYPFSGKQNPVLSNQVFKCTIIEITPEKVVIRLRSRQSNDRLFENIEYWNLEHDLLDSSFIGMYRALFEWAQAPKRQKQLLLGMEAPRQTAPLDIEGPADLTREQADIFRQLLAAEDYFLLWGPPGTGKTSIMLRSLVDYLMEHTSENILLLAYTNRAVDEICESIEALGDHMRDEYFRIGSRYSTSPAFRDQLLRSKTEGINKRKDLIELIDRHRIVVGTVSSMAGKAELFELKKFDRVIIDEASQILEPLLAGLLTRFPKFILIGDHKQLPAVVSQNQDLTGIKDPDLNELGLNSCSNSLFERLFMRAQEKGWHWVYAQLSHQGRMHQDIMAFPNEYFYEKSLHILPKEIPVHIRQQRLLSFMKKIDFGEMGRLLCENRTVFLPTPADDLRHGLKTNLHEAELVGKLVQYYHQLYQKNDLSVTASTIGIITPYRAQIAQIRHTLQELGIDPASLTIDTVERYQGGARDVIIISLCTNTLSQLASISSLSEEGVDRKLNVALTRAREQLIILGNPDLLKAQPLYRQLMDNFQIK
jgi:DNA replication ATP-dependent helicase Dna2